MKLFISLPDRIKPYYIQQYTRSSFSTRFIMTSKQGESIELHNYENSEITDESEYVYDEGPDSTNSKNSIRRSYDAEYVYDEDDGEYVLERDDRPSVSNATKKSSQETKKPGHKTTEDGLYNELDYDLSPRNEKVSENIEVHSDKVASLESKKKCQITKKKKTIIVAILGIGFIDTIIGVSYCWIGVKEKGE